MTTKLHVPVLIELEDPRACGGCSLLRRSYERGPTCEAFPTNRGRARSLRYIKINNRYEPRRLTQCVEQAKEVKP